ncbi:MAG: hypothetical protein ACK4R9_09775 [Ignavibacterium sp.]
MKKMNFFFVVMLLLVIFINSSINAQYYEALKKSAHDYLISLSDSNSSSLSHFLNLKYNLFNSVDKKTLSKTFQISENELDSSRSNFYEFETAIKNISKDSALLLFNYWYLHFSNLFYNYADEKCFSSETAKIILFSTSMSCACTLEMARNQTLDLLKFQKEITDDYNNENEKPFIWIIDSYEHNELQIRYETLFAPSVIVLDRNNELIWKIEYEDDMIEHLSQYINNNLYRNN